MLEGGVLHASDVALCMDDRIFFPGGSLFPVLPCPTFQIGRPMVPIARFKSSPSLGLHLGGSGNLRMVLRRKLRLSFCAPW